MKYFQSNLAKFLRDKYLKWMLNFSAINNVFSCTYARNHHTQLKRGRWLISKYCMDSENARDKNVSMHISERFLEIPQ